MRSSLCLVMFAVLVVACGKKPDAPPPGVASGSATVTPPATAVAPAPASGSSSVGSGSATVAAVAKTCADGDAAACVAEANRVAPQGGYRATLSKADADAKEQATTKLASRACELGNGEGCALVARYGGFSGSDSMLAKACELGYVASCGSVGRGLADGGKKADRARAAELLEKACDADVMDWMSLTAHHGGFCRQLQRFYTETMKDKVKAKAAHDRACAQGDKVGCACKTDVDCGKVPDDQSGDFTCADGVCDLVGG